MGSNIMQNRAASAPNRKDGGGIATSSNGAWNLALGLLLQKMARFLDFSFLLNPNMQIDMQSITLF